MFEEKICANYMTNRRDGWPRMPSVRRTGSPLSRLRTEQTIQCKDWRDWMLLVPSQNEEMV